MSQSFFPCKIIMNFVSYLCFRITGSSTPAENSFRGIPTRFARPLWVYASAHRCYPIWRGLYHAQMDVAPHESNDRKDGAERRADCGKDRYEINASLLAYCDQEWRYAHYRAGWNAILWNCQRGAPSRTNASQKKALGPIAENGADSFPLRNSQLPRIQECLRILSARNYLLRSHGFKNPALPQCLRRNAYQIPGDGETGGRQNPRRLSCPTLTARDRRADLQTGYRFYSARTRRPCRHCRRQVTIHARHGRCSAVPRNPWSLI